jgi:ubiquinone/menaquinone biosynthesis C-methylase UbiE
MSSTAESVRAHYSEIGLISRIDAALKQAGIDPQKARYQDFFAFDQLHSRGIAAIKDHADRAALGPHLRVLDLGCGIGGTSRYLTAERGCSVTGVDLTPEFGEVARELSRRCGLGDKIEFRQANALELPFADEMFDHIWCHYVTMNIPDKAGLAREIACVLKRGGQFSCAEVAQGPAGPPDYPLPWARNAEANFLSTPDKLRTAVESVGLHIVEHIETSSIGLGPAQQGSARGAEGQSLPAGQAVIMGDDFAIRAKNTFRGFSQGKLIEQFILAQRT